MGDPLHNLEQRALRPTKWVYLCMGLMGVAFAIAANATALMLDGLFSGVNFLAALFAARVAGDVARPPDRRRPFGYEIDEPMYVMFRSQIRIGIILVALYDATSDVVTYVRGEPMAGVVLGRVVVYIGLVTVVNIGLAIWYHHHWTTGARQSGLLKTEREAAVMDAVMSLAAGAAFLFIALLKDTRLSFLMPISDSLVVIGLALCMAPIPLRTFRGAVREVVSESAAPAVVNRLRQAFAAALRTEPFELIEVSATQTGRTLFVLAYVVPERPEPAETLDRIRDVLRDACTGECPRSSVEVAFTGRAPYSSEPAGI